MNIYLVESSKEGIKYLIEIAINENNVTNYHYFEVLLQNTNPYKNDSLETYQITKMNKIYDFLSYVHNKFDGKNTEKYRVTDNEEIKMIIERFIYFLSTYNKEVQNHPTINKYSKDMKNLIQQLIGLYKFDISKNKDVANTNNVSDYSNYINYKEYEGLGVGYNLNRNDRLIFTENGALKINHDDLYRKNLKIFRKYLDENKNDRDRSL